MKRKPKLDLAEVLELALMQLEGKERISVPQFTKMGAWFDGLQKTAPRTLRQK